MMADMDDKSALGLNNGRATFDDSLIVAEPALVRGTKVQLAGSLPFLAYLDPLEQVEEPLLSLQQELPPLSLALAGKAFASSEQRSNGESGSWWRDTFGYSQHGFMHLLALVGGLISALFAVKLFVRANSKYSRSAEPNAKQSGFRRRFDAGSFRSLWSSSVRSESVESCSTSAAVVGSTSKQLDLSSAPPDSSAGESGARRKQVELLVGKLVGLLSKRAPEPDESPLVGDASTSLDEGHKVGCEVDQLEQASQMEETGSGSFRSSRSYIKSLIDVLAKARSQIHSGASDLISGKQGQDDEPDLMARQARLLAGKDAPESEDDDCGVVMSQMDISAAHLILDYMEKHLEDKERLRREWCELNAVSGGRPGATSKLNQAVLSRLAKSALEERNRAKNSTLQVVPFDWNRVKLGSPARGCSSLSAALAETGSESAPRQRSAEDYINASFIYDDDPRKPTHIIAQGPNEQSAGQFWQVSWTEF